MTNNSNKRDGIKTYFAVSNGMVKIGRSTNPDKRLKEINICSPIPTTTTFLVVLNRNIEKLLHRKFSQYRSHGEWFYLEGRLNNYLGDLLGKKNIEGQLQLLDHNCTTYSLSHYSRIRKGLGTSPEEILDCWLCDVTSGIIHFLVYHQAIDETDSGRLYAQSEIDQATLFDLLPKFLDQIGCIAAAIPEPGWHNPFYYLNEEDGNKIKTIRIWSKLEHCPILTSMKNSIIRKGFDLFKGLGHDAYIQYAESHTYKAYF